MGQGYRGKTVKLIGVYTVRKPSGATFTYYRRKGHPLVRLPDLPHDDPAFLKAYAEAKEAAAPVQVAKGSMTALIAACVASTTFLRQSEGYRAILRRHFDALKIGYGQLPYSGVRDNHIAADVRKSTAPDHRMKAWRFLLSFAVSENLLPSDPSHGVKPPKREKTDGHPPWTADEIAAYRDRWSIETVPRRAFELLHWTGSRISDAVMIGPGMIDGKGVLTYRQKKTGDMAYVPWTCPLPTHAMGAEKDRQALHEALSHAERHMTFLATQNGRTRSSKALGTLIREAARECEVEKSAHGLRKARAKYLAESGATTHQIASWTGHATLKEVEEYTRAADRYRAAIGTEKEPQVKTSPDKGENQELSG